MTLNKIAAFALGPIGAAALGLITLPFIAWFFSVEDVGRLTILQVVLKLSVAVLSLQLHQAYVREYHEQPDKEALLKAVALPGIITLIFVFSVLVISPFSIAEALFGIDKNLLSLLLFLCIAATFLINLLAHVLRMQERGLAFSATQVAPKLTFLALISLILVCSLDSDFELLMKMNTFSLLSSVFVFLWLTRKSCFGAIKKTVNKPLTNSMLKFSLPLVAGSLAYWGLTAMDRFFLRYLSSFDELGVYAMAASLAAAVSVVSTIFSNLWHPVVYKWISDGVQPERVHRVIEMMAIGFAFLWSVVGLLSWILTYFLPTEYEAVEYLIVACVAMPLFYLLSETTVVGIGIVRKSSYAMLAPFLALLFNAAANYILIPEYGASGAAVASVIAFFIFFAIRTEASAHLWCSLPRFKIYIVAIAYVVATIYIVWTKSMTEYRFLIWTALFSITMILFQNRIVEIYKMSISYFGGSR